MDKRTFLVLLITITLAGVFASVGAFQFFIQAGRNVYDGTDVSGVFELAIELEKTDFNVGEVIRMNISLTNIGEQNETISFNTSPNPNQYWFWRVYNETQHAAFYHEHIAVIPTVDERVLKPGGSIEGEYRWNQKATDNGQQVPPGVYYIVARRSFLHDGEWITLEPQARILIRP